MEQQELKVIEEMRRFYLRTPRSNTAHLLGDQADVYNIEEVELHPTIKMQINDTGRFVFTNLDSEVVEAPHGLFACMFGDTGLEFYIRCNRDHPELLLLGNLSYLVIDDQVCDTTGVPVGPDGEWAPWPHALFSQEQAKVIDGMLSLAEDTQTTPFIQERRASALQALRDYANGVSEEFTPEQALIVYAVLSFASELGFLGGNDETKKNAWRVLKRYKTLSS